MIGDKVWVLHIEHEYGDDFSVHTTEEGARNSLHDYVQRWWEEDGPQGDFDEVVPIPLIRQHAINDYFEAQTDEWFELVEREIVE